MLGIHGQYYDDSGMRHPLLMIVNPDHRGKGIATQMALHLEQEFIAQEGPKYGFTPEEFAASIIDIVLPISVGLMGGIVMFNVPEQ